MKKFKGKKTATQKVAPKLTLTERLLTLQSASPGIKASIRRDLNKHLREKEAEGHSPTMVIAGIRASMKRKCGKIVEF